MLYGCYGIWHQPKPHALSKRGKSLNNTIFVLIWSLVLYPALAGLAQCFSASLRNTLSTDCSSHPMQYALPVWSGIFAPALWGDSLHPLVRPRSNTPSPFLLCGHQSNIWTSRSGIVNRLSSSKATTLRTLRTGAPLPVHTQASAYVASIAFGPLRKIGNPMTYIYIYIWAMMGTQVKPSFLGVSSPRKLGVNKNHNFSMGCWGPRPGSKPPTHRVDPAWVMHNRPRYGWRCRDPNNCDLRATWICG